MIDRKNFLKIIFPFIIVLVIMAGITFVYNDEKSEFKKGETNFELSYQYTIVNEGSIDLTQMTIRLALLQTWEPYQYVNDIIIHTPPNRTTSDEYGNEFVWYDYIDFKAGSSLVLKFDVNLTLNFLDYTNYEFTNEIYNKNSERYKLFMAYDSLADPNNLRVQQVANELADPKLNNMEIAFNIYNFSSTYLDYKLLSSSRGADFAISNGYGDCDEYMNLFIALSRANGIPAIGHTAWFADFEEGMITTDQGAIAHAYPMFMSADEHMLPADPTRGKDAIYDNWLKTDQKRITMTRGPNHPYRLLNYKWVPQEVVSDPNVINNYTISIHKMDIKYFSNMRTIIIDGLIAIPVLFIGINLIIAKKIRTKKQEKLEQILEPSLTKKGQI